MFEYLIEDFKTYRPLLSAIKNEYEIMIIHQRDKIRELEPLKVRQGCGAWQSHVPRQNHINVYQLSWLFLQAMLVTVSEQCEKTLLAMKEEEKAGKQGCFQTDLFSMQKYKSQVNVSDLQEMKRENGRLQGIISSLRWVWKVIKSFVVKIGWLIVAFWSVFRDNKLTLNAQVVKVKRNEGNQTTLIIFFPLLKS